MAFGPIPQPAGLDVFAITTYAWYPAVLYMGLVPDLATLRDKARIYWYAALRIMSLVGAAQPHWHITRAFTC